MKKICTTRQHTHYQRGLTLTELMIAMTIGLFVAAGAIYLFSTANTQAKNTKNVVEGADTVQLALAQVAADIRGVNFLGCGRNLGNNVAVPALVQGGGIDLVNYFLDQLPANGAGGPRPFLPPRVFFNVLPNGNGVKSDTAQNPLPINPGTGITVDTAVTAPDAVIMIRGNPDVRQISNSSRASIDAAASPVSNTLNTNSRIQGIDGTQMHLFAINSCSTADIFYGQYAGGNSTDITLDSLSNVAVSALLNKELRIDYPAGSTITNLLPVAYFVGTSSNANNALLNGPTLYQVQSESPNAGGYRRWGTPQPVANWVHQFRIDLGVDTDNDGEANVYKSAVNVTGTDIVVSARVTLAVLSDFGAAVEVAAAGSQAAQNTVEVNGRRKIVTTRSMVVQLRNGA